MSSKIINTAARTMQKQYHNNKGLLKTIDKNTPEYADHAINAVALEQVF